MPTAVGNYFSPPNTTQPPMIVHKLLMLAAKSVLRFVVGLKSP